MSEVLSESYRYSDSPATATTNGSTIGIRGNGAWVNVSHLPVTMRSAPTVTIYSTTGTSGKVRNAQAGSDENGSVNTIGEKSFNVSGTTGTLQTAVLYQYQASAEL